jgi:L-ascorbate metabolism protein UlaG (beta-lactamase superfamily)
MKKGLVFLLITVLLAGCSNPVKNNTVQVTYVGNSGFLITVGDKKVLVDALIDGFPPEYSLPQEVQDKIIHSEAPFNHVDLILSSHDHADHFSATMVRQYLQNNPGTIFISTTQAVSQLSGFGEQVIAVDPQAGSPVTVTANDIQVEAIYISHGQVPAGQTEIYNNAYLVTLNGIKFFHTGDIGNLWDLASYNLASQAIDLAFIQHFYFRDDSARSFLETSIGAQYYFPIHYHFTTPSFSANLIKDYYPDAIVFSNELETWTMP